MTIPLEAREEKADQLRSLTRAITLLRLLALRDGTPARLGDLAESSRLHKATAHRILTALVREGLVQHDAEGYVLGPELYMFGSVAAKRFDIKVTSGPALERIAARTGDVALLFVRSGGAGVCIARREGAAPIIPGTTRVGTVKPLGIGAGSLALLAAMDPAEANAIIERGEAARVQAHPQFTAERVRRDVDATRERGFSVDDQVLTPGVTAVGVAIRDWRGRPIAAFSCTAFAERLPPADRPDRAAMLRNEAEAITRSLSPREDPNL